MRRKSCRLLSILLILCFPTQAILLWLENDTVIHGDIVEYNESVLVIQRLDNTGIVEIPWQRLHPLCQNRIKQRLGILEKPDVSHLIAGVKVYLKNGGIVYGKMIADQETQLLLQTSNNSAAVAVPKDNVYKIEPTQIAITTIYTPDQIYRNFQKDYDLQTADGNFKFAQFLVKSALYDRSEEHFQKAEQLQPTLSPAIAILRNKMNQARIQQKNESGLRKIKHYERNQRYEKALEVLEGLKAGLSTEEFDKTKSSILSGQKKYLEQQIGQEWFKKFPLKIARITRDRQVSLEEARKYVVTTMPQEITEELAQEYRIPSEQVEEFFKNRIAASPRRYSYGDGSFIVSTSTATPDKSYLDGKLQIKFSSAETQDNMDATSWWQEASGMRRSEWLCAYYGENVLSGEIISRQCSQCEGKGKYFRKKQAVTCNVCHGCGHERIVVIK